MNTARLATIALLLALCAMASWRFKTLVNPVTIAWAPWAGMLAGQHLLGAFFPFSTTAGLMVCLAAVAFSLGALMLARVCGPALAPAEVVLRLQPRATLLWSAVSWSLIVVAAANLAVFLYYGFVLGVGRVEGGGLVIYALTDAIQGASWGWIQRALQVGVYIGGVLFAFDTARLRRVGLRTGLFLAIEISHAWIISSRFGAFLLLSFFGLTWSIMFARKLRRLSLRAAALAALALGLGGVFYWNTFARRHGGQLSSFRLALDLTTTFVGPPAAFSTHLATTSGWHFGMLRGVSIQGPLELFGLGRRSLQPITPLEGFSVETNVLSGLAMLLDDLGIAGTAAALMALGAMTTVLAAAFYRRPTMLKATALASLYILLFWLPVTLMSYYVFWTAQFVAVVLLSSVLFSASTAVPTVGAKLASTA